MLWSTCVGHLNRNDGWTWLNLVIGFPQPQRLFRSTSLWSRFWFYFKKGISWQEYFFFGVITPGHSGCESKKCSHKTVSPWRGSLEVHNNLMTTMGGKRQRKAQDVTAKYCIYDKVHTITSTADVVFRSNKGLCQWTWGISTDDRYGSFIVVCEQLIVWCVQYIKSCLIVDVMSRVYGTSV